MTITFINKKQRIIQKNYKRKTAMNEWDYVYEVYKERSFSAAAKNLFVSQPAMYTFPASVRDRGDPERSKMVMPKDSSSFFTAVDSAG